MRAKVRDHCSSKYPAHKTQISSFARLAPFTVELEPAVIGAIFLFTSAKQFQRARGLRMRASNQDRSKQTQRSDIRAAKGGTGDGSNGAVVANAGDRRCFAVGDAKRRHAELLGAKRRFHRVAQTLAKADCDQQVLPRQRSYSSLDVSAAAYGCLGGKSQGHQTVS